MLVPKRTKHRKQMKGKNRGLSYRAADVDFGLAQARTTYGIIGVKVWIFKGEVLQRKARRILQ